MAEVQENNNDYILLYNRDKFLNIEDFMERNYIYGITPDELFNLNKELIYQQYTDNDKKSHENIYGTWPNSGNDLNKKAWLPCPCVLKINPSKVTAETAISQTNAQVISDDFYAFASEKIQEIYQNEGWIKDDYTKRSPDCAVWGWFKSLYFLSEDWYSGKKITEFISLSKYIISLSTSVTANGGSFSIRLPILGAIDSGLNGIYGTEEIDFTYGPTQIINTLIGEIASVYRDVNFFNDWKEYFSKTSFNEIESNFFNWLISSNDLIFISFEQLEMEKRNIDAFTSSAPISENVFDMIGLVDEVKVVAESQSSQGYVEITGRDLMKLLLDDGSFFFNNSTTSSPSEVFANEQSYGKQGDIKEADFVNNGYNNPINRIRLPSGMIDVFANSMNKDITYVMKGVLSQLANVEVVPGYVFDSWGEDRTKFIELEPEKE